jgi:hypothetical protein
MVEGLKVEGWKVVAPARFWVARKARVAKSVDGG